MRRFKTAAIIAGAAIASIVVARRIAANADGDAGQQVRALTLPEHRRLHLTTDDGATLTVYLTGGAGTTVVLPHCWMGGPEVWAPVAHRLVDAGYRVVLYDQQGHGSSTVGSNGMTINGLGDDLRTVLEAVDARNAVLAGHSMGGMTIQSFAIRYPDVLAERVRGIALVATAAHVPELKRTDSGIAILESPWLDRALLAPGGHQLLRRTMGTRAPRAELGLARDLMATCPGNTRARWLEAIAAMDLRAQLEAVDVPTVVVIGPYDRVTPPHCSEELVEHIPNATLVRLPNIGHFVPLEAPDAVTHVIRTLAGEEALKAPSAS